jgi:hypothetical protein
MLGWTAHLLTLPEADPAGVDTRPLALTLGSREIHPFLGLGLRAMRALEDGYPSLQSL